MEVVTVIKLFKLDGSSIFYRFWIRYTRHVKFEYKIYNFTNIFAQIWLCPCELIYTQPNSLCSNPSINEMTEFLISLSILTWRVRCKFAHKIFIKFSFYLKKKNSLLKFRRENINQVHYKSKIIWYVKQIWTITESIWSCSE